MNLKKRKNIADAGKKAKTMQALRMLAPDNQEITDAKECPYKKLCEGIQALGVSATDAQRLVDEFKEATQQKDSAKNLGTKLSKKISDGWHDEDHSELSAILAEWCAEHLGIDEMQALDAIEQWPNDTAPVLFNYQDGKLIAEGAGTGKWECVLGQEPVESWKKV